MSTYMRAHLFAARLGESIGTVIVGPLGGYRVTLRWGDFELASTESRADDGTFEFTKYRKDSSQVGSHRTLTLVLHDIAGREIRFRGGHHVSPRFKFLESGRVSFEDVDDEQIIAGDFLVDIKEAQGFLVTLGTGATPRTIAPGEVVPPGGPTVASGWGLSHGNAVTLLVDNEAFAHATSLCRGTKGSLEEKGSILLSQLTFSIPDLFHTDAAKEAARAIFEFDPPPPLLTNLPRPVRPKDARPERLLIEAADRNVDVRVILNGFSLPLFLKIVLGVLVFPFAGTDGIFATGGITDRFTSADETRRYFGAARPAIKVQEFKQPLLNVGVMHARLGVFDGLQALCMGASFTQSYIDTPDHAIDAPRRGGANGLPNHDAGIGVRGPAVGDVHRTLQLLWNTAAPDHLDTLPRNPPPQASGGDGLCSIQIVRTLTEDRFTEPDPDLQKGEKGVLEAYLRAIANAEDFIYLENQYFIDGRIGDALVNVMKKKRGRAGKPDLQVIVLLNIKPDIGWLVYPFRQRRLITRIRRAIGETPDHPKQFAAFTRWTHETPRPDQRRPRIMPVYIHAKIGIVDETWATVGSANLDPASLDRAIEVNALLFNGVDDQPESEVVAKLRRKLWAEHLGFVDSQGALDLEAPALMNRPAGGWLELWRQRAAATLQQLKTQPSSSTKNMARVLPWPSDNTTHKEPRDYITALGIRSDAVVPIKGTRAFDFNSGNWKRGSKAVMDYD